METTSIKDFRFAPGSAHLLRLADALLRATAQELDTLFCFAALGRGHIKDLIVNEICRRRYL